MTPRNLAVTALFAGPLAAAIDLGLSYVLVYRARASGSELSLDLGTVFAAALSAIGIVLSRRVLEKREAVLESDRFLGVCGVALNAFFLLLVLAGFGVPKIVLHPTD
jgi:hypothetical protein